MKTAVIDANIQIAQFIELPCSYLAEQCFNGLYQRRAKIIVPVLWSYEVTSVMRKAIVMKVLTYERASQLLADLDNMEIEVIAPTVDIHRRALEWAALIGQNKSYDSEYLAIADLYQADFYTADRSLASAAQKAGADWAHWVGENK